MTEELATSTAYPPADTAPVDLAELVALRDFERPAQARIDPVAWAYIAQGTEDEHTLRDNLAVWDRYRLRPRVLVDVSQLDLATTILDRPVALPVGIAPAALHAMCHPEAEIATARAAAAAGALTVVSTLASRSMEAIAAAAPDGRRWFQLYVQPDRGLTRELVKRADAAGYEAIVLTVDLPVLGYRDAVLRTGFDPAPGAYANLDRRDTWARAGLDGVLDARQVPLTWDSLDEIRSWSTRPLVLKGILTAEDARLAVEHGVDGIWVSNHGGRQLDRVAAGLDVLEGVLEAVNGRAEVYLDGGIRRGSQVVIALALGARAVFTARPFLWALACAGQAGVEKALAILREEIARAMSLLGTPTLADLRREHVATLDERTGR